MKKTNYDINLLEKEKYIENQSNKPDEKNCPSKIYI